MRGQHHFIIVQRIFLLCIAWYTNIVSSNAVLSTAYLFVYCTCTSSMVITTNYIFKKNTIYPLPFTAHFETQFGLIGSDFFNGGVESLHKITVYLLIKSYSYIY